MKIAIISTIFYNYRNFINDDIEDGSFKINEYFRAALFQQWEQFVTSSCDFLTDGIARCSPMLLQWSMLSWWVFFFCCKVLVRSHSQPNRPVTKICHFLKIKRKHNFITYIYTYKYFHFIIYLYMYFIKGAFIMHHMKQTPHTEWKF